MAFQYQEKIIRKKVEVHHPEVARNLTLRVCDLFQPNKVGIFLGEVEVLESTTDSYETDKKRILDEIQNGTLNIRYVQNSLIPIIEMTGERDELHRRLRRVFQRRNYSVKPVSEHDKFQYINATCPYGNVVIQREFFNSSSLGISLEVDCRKKPTDKIFEQLNDLFIDSVGLCHWGFRTPESKQYHYQHEFEFPTRAEVSALVKKLSKTTDGMVEVLT